MASGKNLTVYLTSDVSKFRKGLATAGRDTRGFGQKFGNVMAGVGAAAAATAVAVGAVVADAVQAAAGDESTQLRLQRTIKNTTKATSAQAAAVEDYVSKMSKLSGITDDEIRPGLERMLRSTGKIGKAQKLNNLAIRIALATGKPYASVVQSLAKANDGNVNALKKVGLTLGPQTQAYGELIKAQKDLTKQEDLAAAARETYGPTSKEYAKAQEKVAKATQKVANIKGNGVNLIKELNKQVSGAIVTDMQTYGGKVRRIGTAIGEVEESLGKGVIDSLGEFNDAVGDADDTLYDMQDDAYVVGKAIGTLAVDALGAAANFAKGVQAIPLVFGDFVTTVSEAVNNIGDKIGLVDDVTADSIRRQYANQHAANAAAAAAIAGQGAPVAGATGVNANATGSSDRPWTTFDPTRVTRRTADADARARARAAKSRTRP
jgi:hypothetical protein